MSPLRTWAYDFNEIRFPMDAEGFGHAALSELFENVPLAIAVTLGPDHRYAFANKLFRSGLSISEDLIGKTLREALGERYTAQTQAHRQHVLETGESCEIAGLPCGPTSHLGETFWDLKLLPVRDANDQVHGILTLGVDVTERVKARCEADRQAREAAINNERLALAVEATELGFWDWDAATNRTYWSPRQREIFGISEDEPLTHDLWVSAIHPEDREWVVEKVSALSRPSSQGKLRTEYRIIRTDGEVRWISSRGRMLYETVNGEMRATRLLGTILDITERRKNEEARRLLAQELNHRVKNLFAMANAMVTLTARTAASPQEMAVALHGRLEALAKAHELIRPAFAENDPTERETSIIEIVRTILAPHNDQGLPTRIFIDCPPVTVGAKAATSLTLVLHELATNALKYGALSAPDGYIHIVCRQAGATLSFVWQELNGPSIAGQPDSRGFGSQLAHKSVKDQLGGEISYDWRREGLQVALQLPLDQLSQ